MLHTAIAIVFKNQRQEILILKRSDIPVWVLPGGGIEAEETPEDAVCRELFEETGIKGEICRKIAEYSSDDFLSKTVHVFEMSPIDEQSMKTSEESDLVAYYPIQALPKPFLPLHYDWIQDALKNNAGVIKGPLALTYRRALFYGLRHPILMFYYFLARIRKKS